ncbi:CdiA C-terminal domain-containing protein [Cupriavidus pauculus]|uniref:CdiA C-terminal domain-containing protein n=1 Tax=Cupriavidus pauculus TaxID=82633 RepID=UPI003D817C8E
MGPQARLGSSQSALAISLQVSGWLRNTWRILVTKFYFARQWVQEPVGETSDLLVNGVAYDVYTPTTSNPNRIVSAIASKNTQATDIVLDLTNSSVTPEQLGSILQRVRGAGATNITDIKIIKR